MKVTKAVIKRIVKDAASKYPELSREERWKVFLNTCDAALKEGRITPSEHKRWTEPF